MKNSNVQMVQEHNLENETQVQCEKNYNILKVSKFCCKSKKLNFACILLFGTITQSLASMGSIIEDIDMSEKTYQIKPISVSMPIKESFEYLMPDTHLEKYMTNGFNFRRRSYGTGFFQNDEFFWDKETTDFIQSGTKNATLESFKKRKFEAIEIDIRELIHQEIILEAYKKIPKSDYSVGVHQIRIISNTHSPGKPTPEGIHHDGVDYVSVACISTSNVSGGISFILDENPRRVRFEHTLTPGDLLIFDDRPVAHYVSDITPKLPGFAHRDVIVTTFKTN